MLHYQLKTKDKKMSEQNKFKAQWTIFNHSKFSLTGEPWEPNGKEKPSLKFKIHENNPRFMVYMNDNKNKGPIAYALDPIIFQEFAAVLRYVISDKKPNRFGFELKSSYDHRGNRTEKPGPVSKIYVGRNGEGEVYIGFHAKGEALAKFPFTPSWYADLTDANGEKVTKEFGSEIRGTGWINALEAVVGPYMAVHGKEPAEKPGSGNKNTKGNWGGAPQTKNTTDWEADVEY